MHRMVATQINLVVQRIVIYTRGECYPPFKNGCYVDNDGLSNTNYNISCNLSSMHVQFALNLLVVSTASDVFIAVLVAFLVLLHLN